MDEEDNCDEELKYVIFWNTQCEKERGRVFLTICNALREKRIIRKVPNLRKVLL